MTAAFAAASGMLSCKQEGLPSNPVVQYPLKTLILTVAGSDYVATPVVEDDDSRDTMTVSLPEINDRATVKTLILADPTSTVNIKEGDQLLFVDDLYKVVVTSPGGTETVCILKLLYPPPPEPDPEFMYLIMKGTSGGALADGKVHPDDSPKLWAPAFDGKFECYADLTGYAWDNIGVANADQTKGYGHDHSAGLGTSFTVATTEVTPDGGVFPIPGPWGNWSGMWKVNFDTATNELSMLQTVWAIKGTATGEAVKTMTYDADSKKWVITATLSADTFMFTTVPVNTGDAVVTYGGASGKISATGNAITVPEAGDYDIRLDLNDPLAYTYSIVASGEPEPLPFVYVVFKGDGMITAANPTLVSANRDDKYEAYVDVTGKAWQNIGIAKEDKSMGYEYDHGSGLGTSFTVTMTDKAPEVSGAFLVNGPWGNWDGMWKMNFNSTTKELTMLDTRWAVAGTAAGAVPQSLTYTVADKKWTGSLTLSAGAFKFTTIPVTEGDATVTYGLAAGTSDGLSADGGDITVAEAGTYNIVLDLSKAPEYAFSIVKQ